MVYFSFIAQNYNIDNIDDFENSRKKIRVGGKKLGGKSGHDLEILLNQTGLRSEFMPEMLRRGVSWDFVKDKFSYIRLVNDVKTLYAQLLK